MSESSSSTPCTSAQEKLRAASAILGQPARECKSVRECDSVARMLGFAHRHEFAAMLTALAERIEGEEAEGHCACQHDGRGELVSECQTHEEIRTQRDALQREVEQLREQVEASVSPDELAGIAASLDDIKAGRLTCFKCDHSERAEAAEREVETLKGLSKALVNKLDLCKPALDGIAALAHVHWMPYNGPTYGEELDVLRAVLAGYAAKEGQ